MEIGVPWSRLPKPRLDRCSTLSASPLQRGTGNVETDYLNGEIVMIAHQAGLEAPINQRLAMLGRRAAAAGAKPGDMSAEELAALLKQ